MKNLQTLLVVFFAISISGIESCKKKSNSPTASFSLTNNNCIGSCAIIFTNTSTNATTYVWDFGDGVTSTQNSPSHFYSTPGTYTVKLTATGDAGNNTATQTVTIQEAPYYLKYKADGVKVYLYTLTCVRNSTASPRNFTATATDVAGGYPTIKLFLQEPFLGYNGKTIVCNSATGGTNYYNYSTDLNHIYSSMNDGNGIAVSITSSNYTSGGEIKGTFTGSVRTVGGSIVSNITEGEFKLKFSN